MKLLFWFRIARDVHEEVRKKEKDEMFCLTDDGTQLAKCWKFHPVICAYLNPLVSTAYSLQFFQKSTPNSFETPFIQLYNRNHLILFNQVFENVNTHWQGIVVSIYFTMSSMSTMSCTNIYTKIITQSPFLVYWDFCYM